MLGDKTPCGAVVLLLLMMMIMCQWVAVWISTGIRCMYMHSWPHVYSIPICAGPSGTQSLCKAHSVSTLHTMTVRYILIISYYLRLVLPCNLFPPNFTNYNLMCNFCLFHACHMQERSHPHSQDIINNVTYTSYKLLSSHYAVQHVSVRLRHMHSHNFVFMQATLYNSTVPSSDRCALSIAQHIDMLWNTACLLWCICSVSFT